LVILLSGEQMTLPEAEARALILTQDEQADIQKVDDRVILAKTSAEPITIARRISYGRRVGTLIPDGRLTNEQLDVLEASSYRITIFRLGRRKVDLEEIAPPIIEQINARIDLENPEYEIAVICGSKNYFILTKSKIMQQDWFTRRPRSRAYFHPTAIFPKLARALVNLTRVKEGEVLLDPFAGTGSILLEGALVGARCIGVDISGKMVRGALANQKKFNQEWLGVILADSTRLPLMKVDAIVTDIPYGRASSTFDSDVHEIMDALMEISPKLLDKAKRMVLMHPKSVTIQQSKNFELEESHDIYIHRKLTRAITVLRRI
jgi:tRNA (guanine10-N2)-dimethyltransferase